MWGHGEDRVEGGRTQVTQGWAQKPGFYPIGNKDSWKDTEQQSDSVRAFL